MSDGEIINLDLAIIGSGAAGLAAALTAAEGALRSAFLKNSVP